ncbi:MAG: hypothetical protein WAN39_11345 [Candidatus Cybelea sp.]
MDPTTGNVALSGEHKISEIKREGALLVYKTLDGKPVIYYDAGISTFGSCAFDPEGDFFSDYDSQMIELPQGQKTFTTFHVNLPKEKYDLYGPVQWDGTYMTAESPYRRPTIFRFTFSGSTATIVGETHLGREQGTRAYSWIDGNTVLSAYGRYDRRKRLPFWHYPKSGGTPYRRRDQIHLGWMITGIAGTR